MARATANQRPPQRRRPERTGRIEPEVAAIQALLGAPGPEATLNRLLAEQEAAFHATVPPLGEAAAQLRTTWDRESKTLGKQFLDVVTRWDRGWTPIAADLHFPSRELLHVFGADRTGTGGDAFYGHWQLRPGRPAHGADGRRALHDQRMAAVLRRNRRSDCPQDRSGHAQRAALRELVG